MKRGNTFHPQDHRGLNENFKMKQICKNCGFGEEIHPLMNSITGKTCKKFESEIKEAVFSRDEIDRDFEDYKYGN